MATTTATPSRTTATTGTRSVLPLVAFFALAYALSWLILVPAGLGLLPDSAGILAWLAPFGPAVAAFVVTALTGGRSAVGQLLRRMVQWRVGIHWYLLILFGVPLVELLGAFAVLGSVPLDDLAKNWPLIFTSYLPQVLVAVVVIGLAEETGWRGFALPRLQERRARGHRRPGRGVGLVAPAEPALRRLDGRLLRAGAVARSDQHELGFGPGSGSRDGGRVRCTTVWRRRDNVRNRGTRASRRHQGQARIPGREGVNGSPYPKLIRPLPVTGSDEFQPRVQ